MKNAKLFVCSLALLLIFSVNAYAEQIATDTNAIPESKILYAADGVNGNSGNSLEEIFDAPRSRTSVNTPQLTDVIIYSSDDGFSFSAKLLYNNDTLNIDTYGILYRNERTENSGMSDNLVLSEINDTDDIHFVQFCFSKDDHKLTVIMQLYETKELFSFSIPLSEEIFNDIYFLEENPIVDEELEMKIAGLYSISRNLLDEDNAPYHFEYTSPVASSAEPLIQNRATYNSWVALLSDLNDGSAKLSNHPNVETSFFKGTGWQSDNAWNLPYMVYSYSTPNGSSEYLTQITLLDVVPQNYNGPSGQYELGLQVKYNTGVLVKYDKYTDELTVLYYDFGLDLFDVQVGIGNLDNNAFFINRRVGRIYEQSGNVVRAFLSLYAPADFAMSLFDELSHGTNQGTYDVETFDQTISAQKNRYGGKIIKGIIASTEDNHLNRKDHYINIAGTVFWDTTKGFSWIWQYAFSCWRSI